MTDTSSIDALEDENFDLLLVEYLADDISAARAAELNTLLHDSEQRRQQLAETCLIGQLIAETRDDALMSALGDEAIVDDPTDDLVSPERRHRWWSPVVDLINRNSTASMLVSGLFITTILLMLALWTLPEIRKTISPEEAATTFVAKITDTQDATWDESSDGDFKNIDLFAGERLVLNEGLAEVEFADGAKVVLEGPTTLAVTGRGAATLELGRLVARVPPQAIGFTVNTASAEIVDLGTEFGVATEGDRLGDLQVFEGSVEVRLHAEGESARTYQLGGGQALSWSGGRVVTGNITEAATRLRRLINRQPANTSQNAVLVIGEVQFNVGDVPPSPIGPVGDDLLQTSVATMTGENSAALVRNGTTGTASENTKDQNPATTWRQTETTYELDLAAHPLGYDITQINLFSGWVDSRANQSYRIHYSRVGSPEFYSLGGEIVAGVDGPASVLSRTYRRDGRPLLSGIDAIRFTQFDGPVRYDGQESVYREIDVIGVPTIGADHEESN